MRKPIFGWGLLILTASLIGAVPFHSSPILYKKVKIFMLVPPELIMPGVKQIAVLDFTGAEDVEPDAGMRLADQVIAHLVEPDRGIQEVAKKSFLGITTETDEGTTFQKGAVTNPFEIIERSRLSHVMTEQSLEASELVDETNAVKVGRLLGVQAIVMGTLNSRHNDEPWVKKVKAKDSTGREVEVPLQCVQRNVTVSYTARVVSAESGMIFGSTDGSKTASEGLCAEQPSTALRQLTPNLPSVQTLFNTALNGLAPQFVDYITPHFELREFELEKITTKEFRDLADEAAKAAEDLKVDEAYAMYWSIYERDAYNPRVLYNLGLLNEVVGNYEEARDFYKMAYQLKDEGRYEDGLKRVEKSFAYAEALVAAGIELAKYEFRVDREMIEAAMAIEVEIKGSREDRVPVYATASEQGEVVTQVPGGITFTVIEEKGDWYCVKLLGGDQGWIHREKVKVKD